MTTSIESRPTPQPSAPASFAAAPGHGRYDLYAGIHKALRSAMAHTLLQLGSVDPKDRAAIAATLAATQSLLDLCRLHLHDENTFVHPAIERRAPGASGHIADEHLDHERDIAALEAGIATVRACGDGPAAAIAALYRQLSLFVAHNFEHMAYEETRHNALLWAGYSDAELLELEHAIIASIPPDQMMLVLRWMLPALDHPQRLAMLEDMRRTAPVGAFQHVLRMAEDLLPAPEWRKLARSLAASS